jgi:hypothetical protein
MKTDFIDNHDEGGIFMIFVLGMPFILLAVIAILLYLGVIHG